MKRYWKLVVILTLLFAFALSFTLTASALETSREETVIYTGVSWAPPSNWNPLYHDPQAGTVGLLYEPLFHFNPHTEEWTPWLAEEGDWTEDDVYYVKLREEAEWHDGEDVTAEDVVFTFEIAKTADLYYTPIWDNLDEVEAVSEYEVEFRFDEPNYQEWQTFLYGPPPIVPEHVFSEMSTDDIANKANEDPVGSGPYTYGEADEDRMIWQRVDDWWGNDVHGKPGPKFVEDLIVNGNNIALGMLLQEELDISNNFLPGTPGIVENPGYSVTTYYDESPYHLAGNTGLLYLNTEKPGLDDPDFRRALAFALDPQVIVDRTYEGTAATVESNGLFAAWAEYSSEEVLDEYGFEYDPETAKEMLDEAGYVDTDDDGWRETPDGEEINLEMQVPAGWSDWEDIMRISAEQFEAVGVQAETNFTDQTVYNNDMWGGEFDVVFNDYQTQISGTPYTYFQAVASDDIDGDQATQGNFGRYDNQELFDLIDEFNSAPPESDEADETAAEIQKILLQEMPVIPILENPTYSQALTTHWENWPTEDNPTGIACGWAGIWQMGGVQALIELEPAE
ncbi:MAG: ABC transporter substrate-binding protein [Halanaerobiales bacterium]